MSVSNYVKSTIINSLHETNQHSNIELVIHRTSTGRSHSHNTVRVSENQCKRLERTLVGKIAAVVLAIIGIGGAICLTPYLLIPFLLTAGGIAIWSALKKNKVIHEIAYDNNMTTKKSAENKHKILTSGSPKL